MSVFRLFSFRQKDVTSPSLGLGRNSIVGIAGSRGQDVAATPNCLSLSFESETNESLHAVTNALRKMLDMEGMTARASLVLSSHYCRYLSLPWSDALLDTATGREYLRQAFVDVYGDSASDWEIAFPDTPYAQTVVACAVERAVLEQVRDVAIVPGLTHVRPYFSAAYEAFRKEIDTANAVFAIIEDGLMTVGRICERSVVEVDVLSVGAAWPAILVAWLSRTALLEGETGQVFVLCPPAWRGSAPQGAGADWRFLEWPESVREMVAANPALALAACLP